MARFSLEWESRDFAKDLNTLLNGTVCNGANLGSVFEEHSETVWIGHDIRRTKPPADEAIPLCLGGMPRLFMGLSYRLRPDSETKFLMVVTSFVSLCLDEAMTRQLCHFDYERDKSDGWPEAHLQIDAGSPDWREALNRKPMAKLHFPVGGRRYRPTLEDIIEFVVLEGLAEGRPGGGSVCMPHVKSSGFANYALRFGPTPIFPVTPSRAYSLREQRTAPHRVTAAPRVRAAPAPSSRPLTDCSRSV